MSALASSLARVIPSRRHPAAAIGAGLAAHLSLASRCALVQVPRTTNPWIEMVDGAEGPRGPPRPERASSLPAETWTSPTWNWGSARRRPTPLRVVRAHLSSPEVRKSWLVALICSTPLAPVVPLGGGQARHGTRVAARRTLRHGRVRLGRGIVASTSWSACDRECTRTPRKKSSLGRGRPRARV